jgi:Na+:H+ antiporter, NhaA family
MEGGRVRQKVEGALRFLQHEAAGGIVLLIAALLALALANSPWAWLYDALLGTPVVVQVGALRLDKPLLLWINDGLMAIFFFLVGLEIKRELIEGELSVGRQAVLPVIAAAGGMAVPALIYAIVNWGDAQALRGWAIPAATDIAFAVGVLALLGSRVPVSLKIFLLAVAIIDDLGAILVIALFYTYDLSLAALILGGAGIFALAALNVAGVTRLTPYAILGLFIWVCVLKSGVHATLAGVVTALAVPLKTESVENPSPLAWAEESLHPWVTYGVLPLFAFANAGVSLAGMTPASVLEPIPLGIALGLFLGKPIGIYLATYAAIRVGLGTWPEGASRLQVLGVSALGGIGFTMSLFIGLLAFPEPAFAADVRLGVLGGSLLSATLGTVLLLRSARQADAGSSNRGGSNEDRHAP